MRNYRSLVILIFIIAVGYALSYNKSSQPTAKQYKRSPNTKVDLPDTDPSLGPQGTKNRMPDLNQQKKVEKDILGFTIDLEGLQWGEEEISYFIEDLTGQDCGLRQYTRCETKSHFCFGEWKENQEIQFCIAPRQSCLSRTPSRHELTHVKRLMSLYKKDKKMAELQLRRHITSNFVSDCKNELEEGVTRLCEVPSADTCRHHKAEVIRITETETAFCEVPAKDCIL